MVNPFDRSFFRFLIGFVCILCVSFAILYTVGRFTPSSNSPTAALNQ
jgi:1,4-dihydroxy-2-naphthoate octaprenyltransferase